MVGSYISSVSYSDADGPVDTSQMVNNVIDSFQLTETQIGSGSDFKGISCFHEDRKLYIALVLHWQPYRYFVP